MSGKTVDCLLIGHNDMDFVEYEKSIREMGINSGAYRDLYRKFLWYDKRPYHLAEILDLFSRDSDIAGVGQRIHPNRGSENLSPGIAYLGTYLHKHGFTFDYVNAFQDEKEALAEKLSRENIQAIAILTTFYVNVFPIIEIINFIRQYNQTAKILLGGPFITGQIRTLPTQELEHLFRFIDGADVYVYSAQGEATLVKLLEAFNQGLPLENIPNIFYKSDEGYSSTPVQPENNLLVENKVDWSLFKERIGCDAGIRTSISCMFACAFCGYPEQAGKYQELGVPEIEVELMYLHQMNPSMTLHIIDDTFNVPVERFKNILKMMIKNGFKFKWTSYLRCQYVDREMAELMKISGCIGVFIGFESGSDQILKLMNKHATAEKYLQGMALLKEYDIKTFGTFIIGFPGETHDTVKATIQLIKASRLDFFRTNLWYYSYFTPIWRQREQYQLKGAGYDWHHATMDSITASALIDDIILSVDEPICVIQHDSDYYNVFHLVDRAMRFGLTFDQVKTFLGGFTRGIREKLRQPWGSEVSFETLMGLRHVFESGTAAQPGRKDIVDDYHADFSY